MKAKQPKDMTEVWIINSHGVKSSKPAWLAKELLKSHRDWDYCDPEPVGKRKAYPISGGQLTEEGKKRRQSANEKVGVDDEGVQKEYTWVEAKELAKSKDVKIFGKAALSEELGITIK